MTAWSTLAALPTPRYNLGAATDGSGRIYAVGGTTDGNSGLTTVERFDPSTGAWMALPSLADALFYLGAATDSSGRIYATGGQVGAYPQTAVERFDPTAGTWSRLTPMSVAHADHGCAADSTGRIYVVGGRDVNGTPLTTVERFDPSTGAWTTITPLPATFIRGAAAFDTSGRLYVFGGSWANALNGACYRYDPTANAWTQLASMATPRRWLTGFSDSTGKIYAAGGVNSSNAPVSTVERFDPSTGAWTTITAMPTARWGGGGARDGSGRLYVIGGNTATLGSNAVVGTVERDSENVAPNAPTLTSPATGGYLDLTNPVVAWTFSDPDAGDSQSKFDLQYRLQGASTWTPITATTPTTSYTFATGALTAGASYEWQVRTYDSQGVVGPWSSSSFFTAANPPSAPTITAPTAGATVSNTAPLTWSEPNQSAYQVRRVADSSGSPVVGTAYSDTGTVTDTTTRSITVTFDTNNRTEHVQVRVQYQGLWSTWSDVKVAVSYTPPATSSLTLTPQPGSGSLAITYSQPAPGTGQPTVASVDIYVNDGPSAASSTTLTRRATGQPPSGTWTYWLPRSGWDYTGGDVAIVAIATNGTTSTTSS